jgi:hypothetical protein
MCDADGYDLVTGLGDQIEEVVGQVQLSDRRSERALP